MLAAGNRLVIYGDILNGTISNGEELCVPFNSSLTLTVPIESVEMVDGTSTRSHVALVVAEDDTVGISLVAGLDVTGETLVVQAAAHLPQAANSRLQRTSSRGDA